MVPQGSLARWLLENRSLWEMPARQIVSAFASHKWRALWFGIRPKSPLGGWLRKLGRVTVSRLLESYRAVSQTYDVICIGAGPTGLATAIEAKRVGMRPLVIDKGCLCNSLFNYPTNMVFFTTPERLEIGDLPLTCARGKPTRDEALKYYRKATEHYQLEVRLYELVERVAGSDKRFLVRTRTRSGIVGQYRARKIVIATGYYDLPNLLGVPGEDLPHASHYYTEPHPFWQKDVVVIGGCNSAAEVALDLFRAGARHAHLPRRGAKLGDQVLDAPRH